MKAQVHNVNKTETTKKKSSCISAEMPLVLTIAIEFPGDIVECPAVDSVEWKVNLVQKPNLNFGARFNVWPLGVPVFFILYNEVLNHTTTREVNGRTAAKA